MKWNIVADSSSDLTSKEIECGNAQISIVPFTIRIGEDEFIDNEELDVSNMIEVMENSDSPAGTSCPSPHTWTNEFEKAEQIIALTISENLSGSYNSAIAAKNMILDKLKEKKISVLNSKSTGPTLALCVNKITEWIKQGKNFETVSENAEQLIAHTKTVFALCSFDNLVKNGRMSKITGFVAKKLGLWGVGISSEEGRIEIKNKTRGTSGVIRSIIEDMKERDFQGGEVFISHCCNHALAQKLHDKVKELWKDSQITIMETRGLDSFYAERGGLIVAFC